MTSREVESVPEFDEFGITAFTTTRQAGDFNPSSRDQAGDVLARWLGLDQDRGTPHERIVVAHQVHGTRVLVHRSGWNGLLRAGDADGHFAAGSPTLMAVTLADCVPIFLGHPSGAAAVLHSGWKGTAAGIALEGVARFASAGLAAHDVVAHCGPSICDRCYEVGPDVYERVTGRSVEHPTTVDLRARIAEQLRDAGVRRVTISGWCTRCNNDRFFSHRCGDSGRQVGVIVSR